MMMAAVTLEHVTKVFRSKRNEVRAVDDLTVTVADGEFLVLVGPSGCGKTTTLRLIAGLEDVTAGTIRIGDRVVNDVAPRDRDIAMVFQNYALYPHMTVLKNLAFGLKMRRVPRDEINRKVGETARALGLDHLLDRRPAALSGGERQRVALGRAIVRNPKVFLLDEPLSNLDAGLRVQMRTQIKSLQQELGTTTVYVTHDQEEAMTLGERIVVLKDGVVQQRGTPLDVYDRPANRFVAVFMGTPPMNLLEGRLEEAGKTVCFVGGIGRIKWPAALGAALKPHCGRAVAVGIRPEHVQLDEGLQPSTLSPQQRADGRSAIPGSQRANGNPCAPGAGLTAFGEVTVRIVEPLGDSTTVHLATDTGQGLVARLPPTVTVSPGRRVRVVLDLSRAHLFAMDHRGERLV